MLAAAIYGVVGTSVAVALLGLVIMVHEASRLHRATLAALRRPFPTLSGCTCNDKLLAVKNTGAGIALNVRWRFVDESESEMRSVGNLAQQEERELIREPLEVVGYADFAAFHGMCVYYSDIEGKSYWTTFTPQAHSPGLYAARTETGTFR